MGMMTIPSGYGVRYWAHFREDPFSPGDGTEVPGQYVLIRFWKRDYYNSNQGNLLFPADQFHAAGEPVEIEYNSTFDILDATWARRATIRLRTNGTTQDLSDFLTDSEEDFFVTIDRGPAPDLLSTEFCGWLNPYDAAGLYTGGVKPIQLAATCGLGKLADQPFGLFPSRATPRGRVDIHTMLAHALRWSGYDLPIYISLKTFENSMRVAGNPPTAPFNPLQYAFMEGEAYSGKTCRQVIDEICAAFGLHLCQNGGRWEALRTDEVLHEFTIFPATRQWAVFDTYTADIPALVTEPVYEVLHKIGNVKPLRGSKEAFEPARKKHEVVFEYGALINRLANPDFSGRNGSVLTDWTSLGPYNLIGDGSEESPFALQIIGVAPLNPRKPDPTRIVTSLPIARPARQGWSDNWEVECEYVNVNQVGPKLMLVAFVENRGSFFLQPDGSWKTPLDKDFSQWFYFENWYMAGDGVQKAKPSALAKGKLTAQPVPGIRSYTLVLTIYRGGELMGQTAIPEPYLNIRRLRLTLKDGASEELTREVTTAELTGTGRKKITTHTVTMGDQATALAQNPQLRLGAIYKASGQPTRQWFHPTLGAGRLQQQKARGALMLTGKQARVFDGEVVGPVSFGPHKVLFAQELGGVWMLPVSHKWQLRSRRIMFRAVELKAVYSLLETSLKNEWELEEGVRLPIPDELGSGTVEVPITPRPRPTGNIGVPLIISAPKPGGFAVGLTVKRGPFTRRILDAAKTIGKRFPN